MLKELIRLANDLDGNGHRKEADYLDMIIRRAQEEAGSSALFPSREERDKRREERHQEREEKMLGRKQDEHSRMGDLYLEFNLSVKASGDERKDRYVAQQLPEAQGLGGMLFGAGLDKNLLKPSTGRMINRVRLMTSPSWFPGSGLKALEDRGGIPVRVILDQLPSDASEQHANIRPGFDEYESARFEVANAVRDAIARKLGMDSSLLTHDVSQA